MITTQQGNSLLENARSSMDIWLVEILLRLLNSAFQMDDLGPVSPRGSINYTDVTLSEAANLYGAAQEVLDDADMASLQQLMSEWFYFDQLGPIEKIAPAASSLGTITSTSTTGGVPAGSSMLVLLALGVGAYLLFKRS